MSDGDKGLHWSGTFQRLRAESVVLSLVLLISTRLELDLKKLPWVGVEFKGHISKGTVTIFLVAFFIYFLAAWWVRRSRERAAIIADNEKLLQVSNSISQTINNVTMISSPAAKQFSESLADAQNLLEGTANELKTVTLPAAMDHLEKLMVLNDALAREQQMETEVKIGKFRSRSAMGHTLNEFANASQSIASLNHALGTLASSVNETKRQIEAELNEREPRVAATISEVRSAMDDMGRHLRNLRSGIFHDLELFGFRIPFAFCIGLAILAAPQSWEDIKTAASGYITCLNEHGAGCMYRPTSAMDADQSNAVVTPLSAPQG